jgi:hypothetical protein
MPSTGKIFKQLPDFNKKTADPRAQKTPDHYKLPPKEEKIEFECKLLEPTARIRIVDDYFTSQPPIKVSA